MTLGVYLLGALDPTERSEFEAHLSTCEVCRGELVRLAPLPGLLNQISPEDFADDLPPTAVEVDRPFPAHGLGIPAPTPTPVIVPVTEPVPLPVPLPPVATDQPEREDDLARRRRAKRFWQVAGAAAIVVLLTVGGIFGWRALREPVPPPRAEGVTWTATAPGTDMRAAARLVDHEWGTEIQVRTANLPADHDCYLVVYDHYGNRQIAGWWSTDHDPEQEIPASTSFRRSKIERLELKLDEETIAVVIPAPPR